ncbi:hypothetical protein QFC21_001130 [Naganishia friedmannii]|uniref:Uncharacterized protein n=1 Tax=Naganishia friedmannii TaxID=89922 RepID=A0ACC2W997_9TREE|nr:hypothetical protein QFC21_001130 [Naganishia friedmannii]
MRSVNALTCLATLGAISSVSAGPFGWLHLRDESATPAESTQVATPSSSNTTSELDAKLTVDGKNVTITELYAYLNGTASFNASSWLNSTANATHSIVLDLDNEVNGSAEENVGEEIELELSYSTEGAAVLSFLNGTQLCTGDDACREIVGEELGMTKAEIQEVEECVEDELEEDEADVYCDEDADDDGTDDDEDCEEEQQGESSDAAPATASSSLAANNWFAGSAPTSTQGSASATRSNVYNVAAATGVGSSSVPTITSSFYMYQTEGAPAGAQATAFPTAAGGSSSNQAGDGSTITVTEYITIYVQSIYSGSGQEATSILSSSVPVATSQSSSNPGSTYSDSPDTPDSPDLGNDNNMLPSNTDFDDLEGEEWECEETEIDSSDSTLNISEYYNSTDCASILAMNATATDLNSTYADLTAWCANATAAATPASVEPTSSVSETFSDASSSFASATDLPTESASALTSVTMTEAPSATASVTSSFEANQSDDSSDVYTSYVDAYETSYVEPSASATQSSSSAESEATGSESLSKRLSRGFKKVRRAHVGRNAFV